jgi:triosephosphate isomerase
LGYWYRKNGYCRTGSGNACPHPKADFARFGSAIADSMSILYGGSCKPSNAAEIFAKPDVDGGLIGGASLVAADFIAIAKGF